MNRLLKIAVISLLALILLLAGCTGNAPATNENASLAPSLQTTATLPPALSTWPPQGHPPFGILGLPMPVTLTSEDKANMASVATVQSSLFPVEVASFDWYAIIWADSSVPATVWTIDEQTAAKGIPSYISPNAMWYPGVTLTHVEGGVVYQMQLAFDYDSGKTVYSNGPYIPVKSTPGTSLP